MNRNPIPSRSNVAPTAPIHRSPFPNPVEANAPDDVAPEAGLAAAGEAGLEVGPVGDDGVAPVDPEEATAAERPAEVVVGLRAPVVGDGEGFGTVVGEVLPGVAVVEGVCAAVGGVVGGGKPVDVVVAGGLGVQMAA
jgi:hypothetical protein